MVGKINYNIQKHIRNEMHSILNPVYTLRALTETPLLKILKQRNYMNNYISTLMLLSGIIVGSTSPQASMTSIPQNSFTYVFHKGLRMVNYSSNFSLTPTGKALSGWGLSLMLGDTQTYQRQQLTLKSRFQAGVFSPDDSLMLIGLSDATVRLVDTYKIVELKIFPGHLFTGNQGFDVLLVGFSSDGKMVLTGSLPNEVRLWDTHTGEMKKVIKVKDHTIESVAFGRNPKTNEELLLTGLSKGKSILWDIKTGEQRGSLRPYHTDRKSTPVIALALSPDGNTAVTVQGDEAIARLWNINTGKIIHGIKGHKAPILCVTYSPDGKTVLTGSKDKTARLWDAETGKELAVLDPTRKGHIGLVSTVQFTSNGDIFTGLTDGVVILWKRQE